MDTKSKAHQSVFKMEKENENIELRKKILTKDTFLTEKKETVWERLSKVKKQHKNEYNLVPVRSRPNLNTKSVQYAQSNKPLQSNSLSNSLRKPLSTNTRSIKKLPNKFSTLKPIVPKINEGAKEMLVPRSLSNESKSLSDAKTSIAKNLENKTLVPEIYKRVKETMTPNILSDNSKILLDAKPTSFQSLFNESSEDSNEEYRLAPLMYTFSELSDQNKTKILTNVREISIHKDKQKTSLEDNELLKSESKFAKYILQKSDAKSEYRFAALSRQSYSENELKVLNNIGELSRYSPLEDLELVKDVIISDNRLKDLDDYPKLVKDILKTQLHNLWTHELAITKALNDLDSSSLPPQGIQLKLSKKPINKALSYSALQKEKQSLAVDVIFKNVPSLDKEIEILKALGEKLEATLKSTTSQRSGFGLTKMTSTAGKYLSMKYEIIFFPTNAQAKLSVIGIRLCMGIVNEFYMAQKTIFELKNESNRLFYLLERDNKNTRLIRTSFKELKENPDELLRHVKPKNSKVAFNVLEQDPVFFYNTFKNDSSHHYKYDLALKKEEYSINTQITHQVTSVNEVKKSIPRSINRKPRRRCVTPMPPNKYNSPKNSLLKTVLIGFVQMSVFIIFIMALTYPEVKC